MPTANQDHIFDGENVRGGENISRIMSINSYYLHLDSGYLISFHLFSTGFSHPLLSVEFFCRLDNVLSLSIFVKCNFGPTRSSKQLEYFRIHYWSSTIFPEKEYRGLSPNFHIDASVSDLYIPTIGLPILLEEICRPILGLYQSLTDT
jgi:hypothetical protein